MEEMQETWVQFLGGEDPLQEEMATHFSILVWKIPRREDLRGYRVAESLTRKSHWTCTQSCKYCCYLWQMVKLRCCCCYSSDFVWFSVTPWSMHSMKFSRPEYWSGWCFPSPGDFSDSPHIVRLNLRILVFISFQIAFGYLKGQCRYFQDVFCKTKPFRQIWS